VRDRASRDGPVVLGSGSKALPTWVSSAPARIALVDAILSSILAVICGINRPPGDRRTTGRPSGRFFDRIAWSRVVSWLSVDRI